MNASALAQSAYGPRIGGAQTARETEYQILSRVTGALSTARDAGSFPKICEALHQNVKLWSMLAADVAGPANGLPQELRRGVASLAVFSIRTSLQAMQGDRDLTVLIDVNQAMMKGLRSQKAALS